MTVRHEPYDDEMLPDMQDMVGLNASNNVPTTDSTSEIKDTKMAETVGHSISLIDDKTKSQK